MTLIEQIAEKIVAIRYEDLPREATRWAKAAILDTVGVTLAGASEDCARIVAETLGGGVNFHGGPCLIFGSGRRTGPLDAALVNGTAAHALDFDDVSNSLGGHPSAPILPAIFALAETEECIGADFIAAYVAGFETETRIGRGVHYHHYEKGWHPTATLGVFAASLSSGIKANFGTMTKPLHVGHTARNGLFAALLAKGGFTANNAALEHKQGFLMVYNGEGHFDADAILKDWGNPYDVTHPGPGFKQYPCCGSTHPPLDALLALRREHEMPADKIVRIDSWTHPRRLAHTNRPDPKSGLDAKFSVQYCLARATLQGQIRLEDFEGDAHDDPDVRALMSRIHADERSDEALGAEVRVTFAGGEVIAKKVGAALGRSPDNPLPEGALEMKFANCASRALPESSVARLQGMLDTLETQPNIKGVVAAIEAPRKLAAE
jgi:2-methylcitrate dehydratase PrpD